MSPKEEELTIITKEKNEKWSVKPRREDSRIHHLGELNRVYLIT